MVPRRVSCVYCTREGGPDVDVRSLVMKAGVFLTSLISSLRFEDLRQAKPASTVEVRQLLIPQCHTPSSPRMKTLPAY
jgi:hypothetical protein